MTSESPEPARSHSDPEPLTADQLRDLIAHRLLDQEDVVACRSTHTIYVDRLALSVEDHAGLLWRVHVLTEAQS
jgi:hypothetical protein